MSHTSGEIAAKVSAVSLSNPSNTMSQNLKELLYSKKVISTGVCCTTFTPNVYRLYFPDELKLEWKLGSQFGARSRDCA